MKPHPLIGEFNHRQHHQPPALSDWTRFKGTENPPLQEHYKGIFRAMVVTGLKTMELEVRIFNLSGFRNIMDSVWQSVLHIRYIGRQHQIVLFVVCHGGATAGQRACLSMEAGLRPKVALEESLSMHGSRVEAVL
uniref:Uncharacterized protein n=1 Tax=Oryza nivara TaxID=4536 RepID=A0A0E0J8R2_ORYNI